LETGGSGTGTVVLDGHMLSIWTKSTVGTVACIIKKVLLRHFLVVFHPKRSILPMSFLNHNYSKLVNMSCFYFLLARGFFCTHQAHMGQRLKPVILVCIVLNYVFIQQKNCFHHIIRNSFPSIKQCVSTYNGSTKMSCFSFS
jgi:hypothetical protein